MSNKLYDKLARIQRLVLPILSAILTFLVAMEYAWGFALPIEGISATLAALDALLGAVLAILNSEYKKTQAAAIAEADVFEDVPAEDDKEGGVG